jgi:hypothetical protein
MREQSHELGALISKLRLGDDDEMSFGWLSHMFIDLSTKQ